MKKLILVLLCLLSTITYASSDQHIKRNLFLTVSNSWIYPIKIKEGWLWKKERDVFANDSVTWTMLTSSIDNLEIKYYTTAGWLNVPGCPTGTFKTSLTIVVIPSSWDPRVPTCFIK